MVDWITGLKAAEIIIGWVTGIVTALVGLFWFLDKRNANQVDAKVDAKVRAAGEGVGATIVRLQSMEGELSDYDKRLRNIEVSIASLPTAKELADVRVELSAIGATARAMAEQVDTLYNAALRADRGRGGS
ncbi:MAG: DUF2730 family protein [Hyphomonadaceae bacterium]|nr:DUF2730 family protein [Hyphomonadaceae bacterium]